MRMIKATKAIPPTTIPAMAPELIWLEADAVVVCGCAVAVDDDDAPTGDAGVTVDDEITPAEDDVARVDNAEALDDFDPELVFNVALVLAVDKNGAATRGFESRKPGAKSAGGQPLAHGLDSQQPMKGGAVPLHVYHWPEEHCWSGKVP